MDGNRRESLFVPNRILRDWTDSYRIEKLSAEAERLFVRLIMKADDFGRFHADPRLVMVHCFPLLDELRVTQVAGWIAECEKSHNLSVYEDASGRKYLAIIDFKQRTRAATSKFPPPKNKPLDWLPTFDGHLTVNGRSTRGKPPPCTETETETETETQFGGACAVASATVAAVAASQPSKPRDLIWDCIAERFYPDGVPKSQKSRVGKIVSALKEVNATPKEVAIRIGRYQRRWPKVDITPEALVKHWGVFAVEPPHEETNAEAQERINKMIESPLK